MAKIFRRKKRGKYVGNWFVPIGGRDINLGTKDAKEADRRARLAVKGEWPPNEAAARAAAASLDPAAGPAAAIGPEDPTPRPVSVPLAAPPPELPAPAAPAAPAQPPPEPLDDAAAAAAGAVAGNAGEVVEGEQIEREATADAEMRSIMAELTGGAGGDGLIDQLADGGAAGLLWLERKAAELGWKWTLTRRTGKLLVTTQLPPEAIMRKCVRVGLKAWAVTTFPDLTTKLTPGWAITIGLIGGLAQAVSTGKLVDVETGEEAPFPAPNGAPGEPAPGPTTAPAA